MLSITQTKPRLNPEAKLALLHCYSRPDAIMTNYVSKTRFMRFTLINKSATSATHMFMRRCTIRDLGHPNGFEILFKDSGASIRLNDTGLFALMKLSNPQPFRLCAVGSSTHEFDYGESRFTEWILTLKEFLSKNVFKLPSNKELRTQRLVELSTGATELVVGSPSSMFILLIEQIAPRLNSLECSTELLEKAQIYEPMKLDMFTASQTPKQISLCAILRHQIRCLDLRSFSFDADYQFESDLPYQPSLKQLLICSSLDNAPKALKFYKTLQTFAPNLKQLDLHLSSDVNLSNKGQISDEVAYLFDRLQQFGKRCKQETSKLALHFVAYFSLKDNVAYEKLWRKNLRQHPTIVSNKNIQINDDLKSPTTPSFAQTPIVHQPQWSGGIEKLRLSLADDFLYLQFEMQLRKYHEFD